MSHHEFTPPDGARQAVSGSAWARANKIYRSLGYTVTPVVGKRPVLEGWQKPENQIGPESPDEIADEITKKYPHAGIGITLGQVASRNVVAIDVDSYDRAAQDAIANVLLRNYGDRLVMRTGNPAKLGAFLFRCPNIKALNRRTRKFYHSDSSGRRGGMLVEVLSTGQQLVMPPTPHETGSIYAIVGAEFPPAIDKLPIWAPPLLDEIIAALGPFIGEGGKVAAVERRRVGEISSTLVNAPRPAAENLEELAGEISPDELDEAPAPWVGVREEPTAEEVNFAKRALLNEAAALATTREGGRNIALNEAAFKLGTMVGAGWLDEARVYAELAAACRENGLGDGGEFRSTFQSGFESGKASPRPPLAFVRERKAEAFVETVPAEEAGAPPAPTKQEIYKVAEAEAEKEADEWKAALKALFEARDEPGAEWATASDEWAAVDFGDTTIATARPYVSSWLCKSEISLLASQPGQGKSLLTALTAVAIAAERGDILGEDAPLDYCGAVVIASNEDGKEATEQRVRVAAAEHNIGGSDFKWPVIVLPHRLVVAAKAKDLFRPTREAIDFLHKLTDLRRKMPISYLVIDTLISVVDGGNENDNKDQQAVFNILNEIASAAHCAIDVVHHLRKTGNGGSQSEITAEDIRGGGAANAAGRNSRVIVATDVDDVIDVYGVKANNRRKYRRRSFMRYGKQVPTKDPRNGSIIYQDVPYLRLREQPKIQQDEVFAILKTAIVGGPVYKAGRSGALPKNVKTDVSILAEAIGMRRSEVVDAVDRLIFEEKLKANEDRVGKTRVRLSRLRLAGEEAPSDGGGEGK